MDTYEEKIKAYKDLTITNIIETSRTFVPDIYKHTPWLYLRVKNKAHGTELLSENEELCSYMAAYGEMHYTKCRAALQNFPFEELKLTGEIEIIDWGCGQGIATICLIEMLKERNELSLLSTITLIEPSQMALSRAELHVGKVSQGNAKIVSLCKYLPSIDGGGIRNISYSKPTVIHLFSNILDINNIDLVALARLIMQSGSNHYLIGAGPCNNGSPRIQQFTELFSPPEYFSHITSPRYSITSDTLYPYSCYTRCFHYTGWNVELPEHLPNVIPSLIGENPIIDEYDIQTFVQNGAITQSIAEVYTYLSNILDEQDSIYIKPNIGCDNPDIIVIRPNKGVLIVQTFDDDIFSYSWEGPNDQTFQYPYKDIEKQKYLYNLIDEEGKHIPSPTAIVEEYRQSIIRLHMKDVLGRALVKPGCWGIVKKAVCFSKNSQNDVDSYFSILDDKYIHCIGSDSLDLPGQDFLNKIDFNRYNREFDSVVKQSFVSIISPKWHSYKDGRTDWSLSKIQIPLAESEANKVQKIGGVAGAGKTHVLASRAVNAAARTGNDVLILTFNLTLVNFIRHRISETRMDFSWEKIHITNYHQFFKSQASNLQLNSRVFGCFNNENFFDSVQYKTKRYDTIIIDEVQDYTETWLRIIKKYFLALDGEFVVFGDVKQNIYKRKLDKENRIIIPDSPGRWNNTLKKSYRFCSPELAEMMMAFQKEYYPDLEADEIAIEQDLFAEPCLIKYADIGDHISAKQLFNYCVNSIKKYAKSDFANTVILSQACDILRDIDKCYRDAKGFTLTTFETAEQFSTLREQHSYNGRISSAFKNDIDSIRRNKKLHFTMDTAYLKLSTIHSYKGWEADTVILIIGPQKKPNENLPYALTPEENSPELIYTAITRVRKNLLIFNCGNQKYHDFFNKFKQ